MITAIEIERIEKALGFTLREWQINYILDIPMILDMKMTGRHTGKTLAYVIKLLCVNNEPIRAYTIRDIAKVADGWCITNEIYRIDSPYTRWFRNYLLEIYTLFKDAGITTRPVFFTAQEEREYYNMKGLNE